jgi:hypothetical protein
MSLSDRSGPSGSEVPLQKSRGNPCGDLLEPRREQMDNFEANRMTRNHQDDARLIAALDAALAQSPAPPVIGDDLMKPIIEAMELHPKFRNESTRCFGSKWLLLNPRSQANKLSEIAFERGPSAAVAWCHKVYSTERADLRYVSAVHGLQIAQPVKLSNGVSLMPLANLPPSANAEAVQLQFQSSWPDLTTPWPIWATFEKPEDVCSERPSIDVTGQRSDEIERTIRAFTLAVDAAPVIGAPWWRATPVIGVLWGSAPMIGTSWIDFVDPELAKAEIGTLTENPGHEGALNLFSHNVDTDAIEWVERYIRLAPYVRSYCDIAIERLNLARRRNSPGNQAIEGAICLEALLAPDDNHEIVYKLRLRSALLLSTDFDERCKISNYLKEFYDLRSRTVHGNTRKSKPGDTTCAARGLDICAQVLRKIVSLNKKFVPEDWELSGGEPKSPLKT